MTHLQSQLVGQSYVTTLGPCAGLFGLVPMRCIGQLDHSLVVPGPALGLAGLTDATCCLSMLGHMVHNDLQLYMHQV